jgi:1-phosphofructokinase family hexose kinase
MIYTLTLNPAVDLELQIGRFEFNTVARATQSRKDCGGKGFNVSRMLKNLETNSVAMGFIGGKSGEQLEQTLLSLGIQTDFTQITGDTRTNVSIVSEENAEHIKVNEAGPTISQAELDGLIMQVEKNLKAGDWWVLGGSLPPGVDVSIYAHLVTLIENAGAHVILDTSGEALLEGCKAGPTLIKPNLEEALQLVGITEQAAGKTKDWVGEILALGPKNLVISLGKEGALLATAEGHTVVASPKIIERNPIGAGDSLVGGLVWRLSQGEPLEEALRYGIACGAATASQPGTSLGTLADVNRLVTECEPISETAEIG